MKKYHVGSRRNETSYLHNKRRKINCIGNILCRSCFPKHVLEGKVEANIDVAERRGKKGVSSHWMSLKSPLDGDPFHAQARATLHPLMHASWRKSRASLAAWLFLFRRY